MATPTIVVLVVGVLVTVMGVAFLALVGAQRLRRAYEEATRAIGRLQPTLRELSEQQLVTTREMARVGDALDTLRAQRDERRSR